MNLTTALSMKKLPKCDSCPSADRQPGEHLCKDSGCARFGQYYCEVCQDPDRELHRHVTFKTVQVINKNNHMWLEKIESTDKLLRDVNDLFKQKENLIRFLDRTLIERGKRDPQLKNLVADYDLLAPFLSNLKNHYQTVILPQVNNLLAKEMLAELSAFGNFEMTYSELRHL
jgi:hypothetical protein